MLEKRNRLYLLLAGVCCAGYAWLLFWLWQNPLSGVTRLAVGCFIKNVTTMPCPSCGSTQSVICILHGEFLDAIYWNPLGFVILSGLVIMPVWIMFDLLLRKQTLFMTYQKAEKQLGTRRVALPLIIIVIANWAWNITKGI